MGSFAGAAASLGMSPQMVAKHVNYLEGRLGTRLLNRTTRRQSLTVIGKSYYDRCKTVLAEVDWAEAAADEAKGEPRGRLRINAPVSFGSHSLVPLIARYMRRHPKVEVDLVLDDRYVDLIEDGFEAVFRIGRLEDSSFTARRLMPFQLIACASPAYLKTRGMPDTPADLSGHDCLAYADSSNSMAHDWHFLKDDRRFDVAISARLRINNATALMTAALDGLGIAFIAQDLVRRALDAGHLVQILADYETPSRPMHLVYQRDRRRTPKLRSFIDGVVDEIGIDRTNGPEPH